MAETITTSAAKAYTFMPSTSGMRYRSVVELERQVGTQAVADEQADGNRHQGQQGQSPKQDIGHLAAFEAEHAQTGQFAVTLRQGNAHAVVDHAEGNARTQQGGDKGKEQDGLRHGVIERAGWPTPARPPRRCAACP